MKLPNGSYAAITIGVGLVLLCYVTMSDSSSKGILDSELFTVSSVELPLRPTVVYTAADAIRSQIFSTSTIDAMPNQTIHVVLMVAENSKPKRAGIALCERVETLLKSMLTFYEGPLHLHMLTNTRSSAILSTLFRTWSLANVRTSFYNVEEDQDSLIWVKSIHAVNGYGQLKYMIHDILPDWVEQDIRVLHSYFDEMVSRGVMFAAAPDHYRRKDLEKTLGKGASHRSVNSGLVLYNLRAMRAGNFSEIWRETGVMLMNKLGILACPQDLLAAVAIQRPDIYMKLPCVYNFQLGKYTLPWNCLKNESELWKAKIPHWTGQKKFSDDSLSHSAYFTPLYRCFQHMDAYEFEGNNEAVKYRTLTNLRNLKRNERSDDVTLAIYVNFREAVEVMLRLNATWKGPISLVICGTSWDRAQLLNFFFENRILHDQFSVHFVYSRNETCPIDYLRRLAIDTSRTNSVLLTDSITSSRANQDWLKNVGRNADSQSTIVFRDRKTSQFVGALLDKSNGQLIAAGKLSTEDAIKAYKLKHDTLEVDSAPRSTPHHKLSDWEISVPSSSYCQFEIERRRTK